MQKWSLESFDAAPVAKRSAAAPAHVFEPQAADAGPAAPSAEARLFRHESGFSDTKALMNALTREERAQVYQLVELDLADEYKAREAKLVAAHEAALQELATEQQRLLADWTARLAAAVGQELQDAAAASARLAVQMAARIVRREVALDPTVICRAIETTLFKIAESTPLTIKAHPADAAWLSGQDELLKQLHIGDVTADRRLERGGCLIQSRGREWDASLERQLAHLAAVVEEAIATTDSERRDLPVLPSDPAAPAVTTDRAPAPEDTDAPGLE